jgi:hypothetical protein
MGNNTYTIKGPCVIAVAGKNIWTSDAGVTVTMDPPTFGITTDAYGTIDMRRDGMVHKISFTPVGVWTDVLDLIFTCVNKQPGASLFGTDDTLVIKPLLASQKGLTYKNVALTGVPGSVPLSAGKQITGQFTYTAIAKRTTPAGAMADLVTELDYAVLTGLPDAADLNASIATVPWTAEFGDGATAPWDAIETEDGFTLDFALESDESRNDSCGLVDITYVGASVAVRCLPLGITMTQLLAKTAYGLRGTAMATGSLVLTSSATTLTIPNSALTVVGGAWGAKQNRIGEFRWQSLRGVTGGVLQDLIQGDT